MAKSKGKGKGSKKTNVGAKDKYIQWDIETRLPEIEQWAREGATDEIVYTRLGISKQTFYNWKKKYPDLHEAIRKGKEVVDAEIENKLLDNARGSVFWEVTEEPVWDEAEGREVLKVTKRVLKHIKPDTTAQIFWLKNRRPDIWRDKHDHNISGDLSLNLQIDYGEGEDDGGSSTNG